MTPPSPEAAREARCPARHNECCTSINKALGWSNALSGDRCDACFALGPETPAAAAYRAQQVTLTLSIYRENPVLIASLPHHVRDKLASHFPPEEWAALTSHPAVQDRLARADRWVPVRPSWEKALAFTRSLASEVTADMVGGTLSSSERNQRNVSCFGLTVKGRRLAEPCDSLALSRDGAHHYCADCGCGDTILARLDMVPPETRSKLDFPYLECPRKRPGFSNAPSSSPFEEPPLNVATLVDHVYLINMDRRDDRLASFRERMPRVSWPFDVGPDRFQATDAQVCPPPEGWMSGAGAWGCLRSHLRVLEDAMMRKYRSILVLEDDAVLPLDFADRLTSFLGRVPDDWECLMLGGQHRPHDDNRQLLEPGVARCLNAQRTHAFILREQAIPALYREWCTRWGHCDHIMGPFLGARGRTYAPDPFIVSQAPGKSDINGKDLPERLWASHPAEVPVVIVVCPPERCLAIRERMEGLGCHFGYQVHPRTKMDTAVQSCFEKDPPVFTELGSRWLTPVSWEALSRGKLPAIIHPKLRLEHVPSIAAAIGKDRARPVHIPSLEACKPIQEILACAPSASTSTVAPTAVTLSSPSPASPTSVSTVSAPAT